VTPRHPGLQEVPAALAAQLAGAPWDEPPALYVIGLHDSQCELHPLRVPRFAWDEMPLQRVIAIAGSNPGIIASARRPGLAIIGAAIRFEARGLPRPSLHDPAPD
jgi:hypothetical protein